MRVRTSLLTMLTAAAAIAAFAAAPAAADASAPRVSAPTTIKQDCATPTTPHTMMCFGLTRTDSAAVHRTAATALVAPDGYSPTDLASAYDLDRTSGTGATIAIVDAYDDPNADADLAVYRDQFELGPCTVANGCLTILNQSGAVSPLPAANAGWAAEESLDLDMASAICPHCRIDLIEANSATDGDLVAAEDRATALAKFVSNSWGGNEFLGENEFDAHFDKPGVAIVFSTGDDGTGASYPATSPYVTAAGGTHLVTAANSRGWTETAWGGAGSACSAYEPKPAWQTVTTNCSHRAEADVSAVADPNTGVAVYNSYSGAGGWNVAGGTSAAAPIITGVYALAGTPAPGLMANTFPYAHAGNLFDVTSGVNGTCGAPICTAGTGWDGPTGLGTPNGSNAFTNSPAPLLMINPGVQTASIGAAVSLPMPTTGGTKPYTYSASGLPAGLSINAASGLISGTPTAAGSMTSSVTVTDHTGTQVLDQIPWTVNAACTAAQLIGNPGFESVTALPWSMPANLIDVSGSGETAHSGTHFVWLDGHGITHTDTISQTVTVPAHCTAKVSFWLHVDTADTGTTAHDKLTVKANGTVLTVLSNLNRNIGYAPFSYTLPANTSGAVTLTFSGVEDASLQTSFVLDDVALNVT
jgi:hypothetical protein